MTGDVTIIAVYIILGIIIFFYVVLRFSVKISYSADSISSEAEFKIKWLWFDIYPKKKADKNSTEPAKKQRSEHIQKPKAISDNDNRIKELEKEIKREKIKLNETYSQAELKESRKNRHKREDRTTSKKKDKGGFRFKIKDLKEKWELYKPYIPIGWKAFKKLTKQIRLYDTEIEITAGREDAYEAAMLYGRLNALMFSVLGLAGCMFSLLKPRKAEVRCVFDKKCFEARVSGVIRLRPSSVFAILICCGVNAVKVFLRQRRNKKKNNTNKIIKTEEMLVNG